MALDRHPNTESSELAHRLQGRVRELNCLYGISHVIDRAGGSLEQILRETVQLLPAAWEYPDVACARIAMGELEVRTEGFAEPAWALSAPIRVRGVAAGEVQVGYLAERPRRDDGPFRRGEQVLLDAVAERLGRVAERLQADRLLREREEELRARFAHLSRVSTMGEMASGIAHEVNQPLTAIATYAQACRRLLEQGEVESGEILDILRRIDREAGRAGAIVHRIKDLVRNRDGDRVECSVNALIRDVEQLAAVDARLHHAPLVVDLAESLPLVVADGVQIQQVVLNLIRNALDAMQDVPAAEREVVVTTARAGTGVRVTVSDVGPGLPPGSEQRVFEPFFTTKPEGIGMGLPISHSIVRAHGGAMTVSRHARRTLVSFTLPSVDDDA